MGGWGVLNTVSCLKSRPSEKKSSGRLRFNSANIAIHMLNRSFVEKLCRQENFSLPYHKAFKEIESLVVNDGRLVHKTIKGIKFEMFIFDALGFAERTVALEVPREEEFFTC